MEKNREINYSAKTNIHAAKITDVINHLMNQPRNHQLQYSTSNFLRKIKKKFSLRIIMTLQISFLKKNSNSEGNHHHKEKENILYYGKERPWHALCMRENKKWRKRALHTSLFIYKTITQPYVYSFPSPTHTQINFTLLTIL